MEQGHPGSMPLQMLLSLGPANRGPLSAPPALIQALFLLQVASLQEGVVGIDPQGQKPMAGRLRCLFFQELSEVSHLIGAIYIPLFGQYLYIVLKEKPFVGFQVLIHSVQALILPLQVLDFFWEESSIESFDMDFSTICKYQVLWQGELKRGCPERQQHLHLLKTVHLG
uniref:Uncharacterized protein n=1 Tax=Chromera velia CCMP2878 TaxID=1169474 RepID=A0A0G4H2W0_9ALVE|eukprot:Cvel_24449.t1-p1 / transcript=Cvel_24449.t1 / gene=Cvel_24449 / organism=Chromera_velia_CCMP2878 / gene_product=hypothetical protein / transcript_product=hypothetical protein / location=Cvel_scaffold2643:16965-22239(+) / protein_length=168 / sequence_SO=supercontig / SO=protein_coding / is_pseudo=false